MNAPHASALFSFILAVLPALGLLIYFYRLDSRKPEPRLLIGKVFLLGVGSAVGLVLFHLWLDQFQLYVHWTQRAYRFFESYVLAGWLEEGLKLAIVLCFAFRLKAFDEPVDGIIYTITASLGFACAENILYVLGHSWQLALARGVTAVPLHAVASGLMGYFVGQARFAPPHQRAPLIARGWILAVLIHGTYDYFLTLSPHGGLLYAASIVFFLYGLYKRLLKRIGQALPHDEKS